MQKILHWQNMSFAQPLGRTTKKESSHPIEYPWASNFVEWLLPKLRAKKVPVKNPDTGGDYYDLTIGKKDSR